MLERLFNLQQFGDNLSRKLSAKISKERTDSNILAGQLSGYSDVSQEKLKEKENALEELKNNLEALKKELDIIEKKHKENEEIWKLQLDLLYYKNKEQTLKEKEENINSYIEKIKLGEAGAKVLPYLNAFESTRKAFDKNEIELEELKSKIGKIKEEKEKIEQLWCMAKDKKENKLPQLMMQEQKVKDAIEEKNLIREIENKIDLLKAQIKECDAKNNNIQSELIKIEEEISNKNKLIKEDEKHMII